MSTINRLSAVDSLQGGDNIPLYDSSNGDARRSSLTILYEWLLSIWVYPSTLKREPLFILATSLPASSTVTVPLTGDSYQYALGGSAVTLCAMALPGSADASDKQEVFITATTAITQLQFTIGAGATGVGAGFQGPYAAGDSVKFKYNLSDTTWYRVERGVV